MPLLRGPYNARPPAGAAPHSGGRRRKRAGLELLLRNPLFFLIFAVRVSQKFCRATIRIAIFFKKASKLFHFKKFLIFVHPLLIDVKFLQSFPSPKLFFNPGMNNNSCRMNTFARLNPMLPGAYVFLHKMRGNVGVFLNINLLTVNIYRSIIPTVSGISDRSSSI